MAWSNGPSQAGHGLHAGREGGVATSNKKIKTARWSARIAPRKAMILRVPKELLLSS